MDFGFRALASLAAGVDGFGSNPDPTCQGESF